MLRKRHAKAFAVVEFLIASGLTLLVFVFGLLALESNNRLIAVDEARDSAVAVSYDVLDKARIYGCANVSGDVTSADLVAQAAAVKDRCESIFSGPLNSDADLLSKVTTSVGSSLALNSSYSGTLNGSDGRSYLVTLNYEYDTENGRLCSVDSGEYETPGIARYTVDVYWVVKDVVKTMKTVTTEPLPASFRFADNGILVKFNSAVSGKPKTVELLVSRPGVGGGLQPVTSRTTTSDCVWLSNFGASNQYSDIAIRVNKTGSTQSVYSLLRNKPAVNVSLPVSVGGA